MHTRDRGAPRAYRSVSKQCRFVPTPIRTNCRGLEINLGVNYYGHFALSLGLLPTLVRAPQPKVVHVTSVSYKLAHALTTWHNKNAKPAMPTAWSSYAHSKLANLLFAAHLHHKAGQLGLNLTSVAAHPGFIHSNLMKDNRLAALGAKLFAQPASAGAACILAAQSPPSGVWQAPVWAQPGY